MVTGLNAHGQRPCRLFPRERVRSLARGSHHPDRLPGLLLGPNGPPSLKARSVVYDPTATWPVRRCRWYRVA